MNCIYCELGPSKVTYYKAPFCPPSGEILSEIEEFCFLHRRHFDCLTFTASGEPTLHEELGVLLAESKKITGRPVTVLTNSSTVTSKQTRNILSMADIVLPSLDAVTPMTFRKINRPHPGLDIYAIIDGLSRLRREMAGKMWLEILLVRGINDGADELLALRDAVNRINPHKIQLNTVARPPAEDYAKPVGSKKMREILSFFGEKAEIVIDFEAQMGSGSGLILESEIMDTLRRRPLSFRDMEGLFGRYEKTQKILSHLIDKGMIEEKKLKGRTFYAALNNK